MSERSDHALIDCGLVFQRIGLKSFQMNKDWCGLVASFWKWKPDLSALSVRSGVEMSEELDKEESGAGEVGVELGKMMVEDVESGGIESDLEDAGWGGRADWSR